VLRMEDKTWRRIRCIQTSTKERGGEGLNLFENVDRSQTNHNLPGDINDDIAPEGR
jgi:hypothetical protein